MVRKPLPIEMIVGLYHQLANIPAKHPRRLRRTQETAEAVNVSLSTVRRALKIIANPDLFNALIYNQPRKINTEEMLHYCELIAALKIRSISRRG